MRKKTLCIQYDNAEKICCWSGCHRKNYKITLKPGYIDKVYAKGDKWHESDINNNKDVHAERVTDPEPEINESR